MPANATAPRPLTIGRYQVTDRLGEGGMGIVYLARDPALERFLAIKLMRHGFDNADYRERFAREARTVASLRHPSIVTVFEYGDHDGQPFIVMEYVAGKTLAELFATGTPLSLIRRLQLAEDLCRGLDHAHKAGIVHRDVKPANIMVDAEGTLKILDFGIAKRDQTTVTQFNVLVGTPTYMSPEQIAGRAVTRRSDIFSVGLVFYELLSSTPAFRGASQFVVMNAILNDEPAPLASIVPGLDPRIVRIVEKALEKDVDRRYQDLAQMRRDIERLRMELAVADPSLSTTIKPMPQGKAQIEELSRRRAQQIAANLETAERAFELGDYTAALAACEDALILDPNDANALEGLHRAHAAMEERQALAHLAAARQHFAKDELTAAEARLNAATAMAPALLEGVELRQQLEGARRRNDERARALKLALDRARIRFEEGAFESALKAADEALACSPSDRDALQLKAGAAAAVDAMRQRREIERRAQAALDAACRLAGRDRYADALRLLDDPAIADRPAVVQARGAIAIEEAEFVRLQQQATARLERPVVPPVASAEREHTPSAQTTPATVPSPAVATPADAQPVPFVFGTRTVLVPPDIVAVRSAVPMRRKPKPIRRPYVDRAVADRGGDRAWFGDGVFVERTDSHDSVGYGASAGTHAVAAVALVAFLITRPVVTPAVKGPSLTYMPVAAALPAVEIRRPDPPKPEPLKSAPSAPKRVVDRTPPRSAEVRTDNTKLPQLGQPVEPGASVDPAPVIPLQAPIDASLGLPIEAPRAGVPTGVPGGSAPAAGVPGGVNEEPVDDYDQDPVLVTRAQPKVPVGASGVVRAEVTVLSTGKVSRARVLDHTAYDALIVDAALRCAFQPAKRRGKAVPVVITLNFKLDTRK